MHEMGLKALSPHQMTSVPKKEHPIYPYLLKDKRIRYPNQVWATDITYLKLDVGYVYLAAIMNLMQPEGLELADISVDGCRLLHRGSEGRHADLRSSSNLQHRSGEPVHFLRFHQSTLRIPVWRSAWMDRGAGGTTLMSNDFGGH